MPRGRRPRRRPGVARVPLAIAGDFPRETAPCTRRLRGEVATGRRGGARCTPSRAPSRGPGAVGSGISPSSSCGRLPMMFHQNGSRSGWKHSTYVPCGWLRAGARRPAAPRGGPSRRRSAGATAAMRRQSVGPPVQEASKLQTSIAPVSMRSRQPRGEYSLWPAHDRDAAAQRTSRMRAPVVVPAARLLEPADVETLDAAGRCRARSAHRVALVGVDGEDEVVAAGLARPRTRSASFSGVMPPTLNLQPARPHLAELRDLLGELGGLAAVVVAPDDDHRHAVAVAAPEAPQRLAERLADRVPDGGVDARAATRPRRRSRRMSNVDGRRASRQRSVANASRPDQPRRDLVADDRRRSRAGSCPRRRRRPRRRCPPP